MTHPIENYFPRLGVGNYQITSPASELYNCIAWAAGYDDLWWWPDHLELYYWPPGLPRLETVGAFAQAFAALGYTPCQTAEIEPGFEKVAIYADTRGRPTHAARQLPGGPWTSKLGKLEDIEHGNLECLERTSYGSLALFLKRPVQDKDR